MAFVIMEWVRLDAEPPVTTDKLALILHFEEWDNPLPRVGDSVAPPEGPMHDPGSQIDTDWLVSSVSWELTSDEESAGLESIRIVIHETEMSIQVD